MTSYQLMLKQFLDSHSGVETALQDNGVVVYVPVQLSSGAMACEAVYCETTRQEHFASKKELLAFVSGYNMAKRADYFDRFADFQPHKKTA